MSKTKKRPIIQSDSEDSDGSDNLDQEVLSLATTSSAAKRPKLTTPAGQSSGSGSSSESGSDNEWTMDGKSGGKKSKINVAKRGRGIGRKMIVSRKPRSSSESSDDDDDDDDDISEGMKPFTAGGFSSSGQSSSSDSESSSSESLQFDDGLDHELIGDEEDRRKLDQMTEAEREREMYNRYEKRAALSTRFEIEKRIRKERKAEKKRSRQRKKQQRPARDTRRQQDKSKSRAMDELKAKRSADKLRKAEAEKQQLQKKEPLKASEVFTSGSEEDSSSGSESSSSYIGDSEDDLGSKSLSGPTKGITTLEQLNKIKLSRYRLEKWVHMPFFKETVIGCYVRIGIGAHDGKMVYRVCEIANVQEGPKVYTLGSTKTNKTLRLKHASQERQFRMEYVSNSQFTDTEFSKWLQELEGQGMRPPTVEMVHKKAKQIGSSKNFAMTDDDIERIIKEKQKFRKNPRNYAMTKNRLIREKELAEVEGDHDKAGQLSTKIDEIDERAEELDKQRTKGLSAISYINERNRQRNVIRAEQALKEEMAATGKDVDDPFTRRKCQPTLVTLAFREGGGQNTAELLQQLSQAKTEQDKEAVKASIKEKAPQLLSPTASNGQSLSGLFSTPAPPKNVEDLFSAHDFDIQIDLPTGPEVASSIKPTPKSTPTQKEDGPRRSLNLSDYKKRRGLI